MKALSLIILSIMILLAATYLYINRDQQIRVDLIPPEFEFCETIITEGDLAYDELKKILVKHKDGWKTSYASFVPGRTYDSPAFKVNVIGNGGVVVSYKTDDGYPQFTKFIKYDWSTSCEKYHK